MISSWPRVFIASRYERAAQDYLRSLPLEHFMEATPQATQREITVESLALVRAKRPDFQLFNELLIQYPDPDDEEARPRGVVPDNMVVIHPEPIDAKGSYDTPLQPIGPFWVFEYVSNSSRRKDYEESYKKYEQDLKVPYYLLFYPDNQELSLFHHNGEKYVTVLPNEQGRLAIPELEIEISLLDGWTRYWYQGELLPLPADLMRDLEKTRRELEKMSRDLEKTSRDLEEERRRITESEKRADSERLARLTAEQELERLRAEVAALQGKTENH